jgi:hypothetical protein
MQGTAPKMVEGDDCNKLYMRAVDAGTAFLSGRWAGGGVLLLLSALLFLAGVFLLHRQS